MKRRLSSARGLLVGLFFGVTLLACDLGGAAKPTIVISSPPSGSTYNEGDNVAVQSSSADATGITRIELSVDGAVVRTDTPPSPQTNFSIIQNWKATQGTHTLTVRAYNASGAASDLAAISIQVGPSVAMDVATPTKPTSGTGTVTGQVTFTGAPSQPAASVKVALVDLPAISTTTGNDGRYTLPNVPAGAHIVSAASNFGSSNPVNVNIPPGGNVTADLVIFTALPTPTPTSSPLPSACTNNAAFVADVTVPDGTNLSAGQPFSKTWRMSNNGTCAWGSGYQFVFVTGEAMTGSTVVSVPPTAPGATVDITVPMTAPTAPGNHVGQWRMRGADGAVFGQTVSVKIAVPGAPPPPSSSCSGNPVIASFTASPNPITAGSSTTLSWGAVTNADSVEIDHGIGGVAAPGSQSISPSSTTTYTITAHCGSNTTTAQVTITVVPPLPPPVMVVYDLIDKANLASWNSGDPYGSLTFGGPDTNANGFVLWRNSYTLNDGSTPPRVLETHPKWVANGYIQGTFTDIFYSGYTVQSSDRISGKVGFLYGALAGNVTFKVMIRPQGGTNTWIITTPVAYADGVKSFNYALAPYAGKKADFILRVEAGASSSQDWAVWQDVRITR
jgi:hypothetical protein